MKTNFIIINSILMILIFFLTACPDPEPDYIYYEPPTISITKDKDTVFCDEKSFFDTVHFVIQITPDYKNNVTLKNLIISYLIGDLKNIDLENSDTAISINYDYLVSDYFKKDTVIILNFKVYDNFSGYNFDYDEIVIDCDYVSEVIESYGNEVNYVSTNAGTEFGWRIAEYGIVITQVNDEDADLVFFFNDSYRQQILSPDAIQIEFQDLYSTWNYEIDGKKNTKIQKSTDYEWDNATFESLNNLLVEREIHPQGGNGVCFVEEGDVFAFELSDRRKGLCKVLYTDYWWKKGVLVNASLTLDFKYQKNINPVY